MPLGPVSTSRGDIKCMTRAAWEGLSNYRAVWGGRRYAASEGGHDKLRYDDAEGWAPRLTFWGSTETIPFDTVIYSGTNDTEVKFKEYTSGLQYLRRKHEDTEESSTGFGDDEGRVLQITNGRASGEVYTNRYNDINSTDGLVTYCPKNSTWYASWYMRKSDSAPSNSNQVRGTVYFFGVNWNGSVWSYQNGISESGGDANGRDRDNPATGHTVYSAQNALTTTWTRYQACFKFNNDAGISGMTVRVDNDDGIWNANDGGSKIYMDRLTLHPVDLHLKVGDLDGDGTQANSDLDSCDWLNYAPSSA